MLSINHNLAALSNLRLGQVLHPALPERSDVKPPRSPDYLLSLFVIGYLYIASIWENEYR
ncbi:hypothetical protein [Nostoc sp.]|uniref:hypothetical protein n=1 Tax=Nostoc sp. TaxID=1180 RepID=UPI002FF9DC57